MSDIFSNIIKIIMGLFSGVNTKDHDPGSSTSIMKTVPAIQKAEAKGKIEPPPPVVAKPRFGLGTTGVVTSQYGWRTMGGQTLFHSGIDFSGNYQWGYPCKAIEDGVVFLNSKDPGALGITTIGIKGDHSKCYIYLCHIGSKDNMISPLVKINDHVSCGQIVGYCNHTGYTTGPHLHLTIYDPAWNRINPMCYYKKFAPEVAAQITNYVSLGHKDPANKSGKECGIL